MSRHLQVYLFAVNIYIISYYDIDSKLSTYLEVNPELKKFEFNAPFEPERIIITRYRTGSHNLKIETGRMCQPPIPREDRLCFCRTDLQTLRHCLLHCPLLIAQRERYNFTSVETAMNELNTSKYLSEMENVYKNFHNT